MIEPTKEQIEAAAEAMHRYDVEHGFNADSLASVENYLSIATAALTAAALEVVKVDETKMDLLPQLQRKTLHIGKDIEAAPIERCAQVVQNSYLPESDKAKLVAAIRALKDSQR